VAVLYNGSAKSNAALTLAARLAESNRQRLIVFVLGDSAAAFAQHEIAVREQLRAMGMSGSIRRLRSADHASLLRSLQSEPIGLLVVAGKGQTAAADMALDLLVEKSNCSVLLVRG
jgi:hypothetical protein